MVIDGNVSFFKLPMQHTASCCPHYRNDKRAVKETTELLKQRRNLTLISLRKINNKSQFKPQNATVFDLYKLSHFSKKFVKIHPGTLR